MRTCPVSSFRSVETGGVEVGLVPDHHVPVLQRVDDLGVGRGVLEGEDAGRRGVRCCGSLPTGGFDLVGDVARDVVAPRARVGVRLAVVGAGAAFLQLVDDPVVRPPAVDDGDGEEGEDGDQPAGDQAAGAGRLPAPGRLGGGESLGAGRAGALPGRLGRRLGRSRRRLGAPGPPRRTAWPDRPAWPRSAGWPGRLAAGRDPPWGRGGVRFFLLAMAAEVTCGVTYDRPSC